MEYQLLYSKASRDQIKKLHPDIKSIIRDRLKTIAQKPYVGKHLERDLSGYFSFRARRFRIIYKVREEDQTIEVHYVGHRRDIYDLLKEGLDSHK
jgi:mRNA-degrading endonuclease RelE of RelBE toxin-antitoxin system